jgi:crotonobetainyl-CoA:carnitine CoA-transferase CaiB-like acyl-CoA transferase
MHAVVALLTAVAEREVTGRGTHIESTMIESALAIAAEQVVEWSAYGRRLERDGNRSPLAAPQGLYACAEGATVTDKWLALSVATDSQWRALRALLGSPAWAVDGALDTREGRRAAHDAVDARLRAWTAGRERVALVAELRAAGIPASEVTNPSRVLQSHPQVAARGYFERLAHPVVGPMPLPSLPYRSTRTRCWLRTPAPTLGQHNEQVLCGVLGISPAELRELEAGGVVGRRPAGL